MPLMDKQRCSSRTLEHVARCWLDQWCCEESRIACFDIPGHHTHTQPGNYVGNELFTTQLCPLAVFSVLRRLQNSSSLKRIVSFKQLRKSLTPRLASDTFTFTFYPFSAVLSSRLTIKLAFYLCERVSLKDCQWWMLWQIPAQWRMQTFYCGQCKLRRMSGCLWATS